MIGGEEWRVGRSELPQAREPLWKSKIRGGGPGLFIIFGQAPPSCTHTQTFRAPAQSMQWGPLFSPTPASALVAMHPIMSPVPPLILSLAGGFLSTSPARSRQVPHTLAVLTKTSPQTTMHTLQRSTSPPQVSRSIYGYAIIETAETASCSLADCVQMILDNRMTGNR